MADVTGNLAGIGDLATKLQTGAAGSGSPVLDVGSFLGNMSMTAMVISLLAGLIGSAYFMYGKKTSNVKMLCGGIALCVVPCFINNTIVLVVASVAMAAAPFVI